MVEDDVTTRELPRHKRETQVCAFDDTWTPSDEREMRACATLYGRIARGERPQPGELDAFAGIGEDTPLARCPSCRHVSDRIQAAGHAYRCRLCEREWELSYLSPERRS